MHPPTHTYTLTHTQRHRKGNIPRHLATVFQSQSGPTHLSLGEKRRGSKQERSHNINRVMYVISEDVEGLGYRVVQTYQRRERGMPKKSVKRADSQD